MRPSNRSARTFVRRLAVAAGLLAAGPAPAMEFTARPPLLFAIGDIRNGDQYAFDKLLEAQPEGSIRAVVLHSGGGFVHAAGEIGRTIREKKLFTVVDAAHGGCASTCTILFAAGVERIYLGASGIGDGTTAHAARGLGFHEGSSTSSRDADHHSGASTGQTIAYHYEFGVPKAADLATRARPNEVYVISGPTALALGIATRLDSPGNAGSPRRKHH